MPQPVVPPQLLTRDDVARLLGLPLHELTWWLWGIRESKRYDIFQIPRRAGEKTRTISAPIKPLKDLQRSLASELSKSYRPPTHVHGFVPGRGPISNARVHVRQEWVLRVDIEDFFPSINYGRVFGMFSSFPFDYPHDVAVMLAQLCCNDNQLPQGAPTSPVIANLICRGMDKELARLAGTERSFFSRYADDLCFSTDRRTFPSSLASLSGEITSVGPALLHVVEANGFEINVAKSRLVRRTQRQRVTGLVVNEKLNVSRDYIRHLRKVLFIWTKRGQQEAEEYFAHSNPERGWPPEKPAPDFRLVIRGRVQFVGSVKGWTSTVYQSLAVALKQADPDFEVHDTQPSEAFEVKLYTEGQTDIDHMLAAQRYFHRKGEFLEVNLKVVRESAAGSDSKLLERCRVLKETAESPCLCLFDTDSADARKAAGPQGLKRWGPLVIAVGLAAPPWLEASEPLCIELLHEDAVLKSTDEDGRRIYLRSEFNKRSPKHKTEDLMIPNVGNKTLVQEEVFDTKGATVAMTKADFAQSIREASSPFQDVAFEGFRPTFELIVEGVAQIREPGATPDG